jgi:hypothetical protein
MRNNNFEITSEEIETFLDLFWLRSSSSVCYIIIYRLVSKIAYEIYFIYIYELYFLLCI